MGWAKITFLERFHMGIKPRSPVFGPSIHAALYTTFVLITLKTVPSVTKKMEHLYARSRIYRLRFVSQTALTLQTAQYYLLTLHFCG